MLAKSYSPSSSNSENIKICLLGVTLEIINEENCRNHVDMSGYTSPTKKGADV
jgi:hypothetical protein